MQAETSPPRVARRVVIHFPGFEPLDAKKHRERYERAMTSTAALWDLQAEVGPLQQRDDASFFDVKAVEVANGQSSDQATESRITILDHCRIVDGLADRPRATRLLRGFESAAAVVVEGAAFAYLRHAWRFGLFFLFPFLIVALALGISLGLATYPLWLGLPLWQIPIGIALGALFFLKLFIPWSERFHTLHLFSDWEMARGVSRLDDPAINAWIDASVAVARRAFEDEADEYLITSHSMGSSMAVHVIGALIEREPQLFNGKRIVFVTLGGATLQCAFLKSAKVLRARVGLIARDPRITFIEVQCLTDVVNFYKSALTVLTGHPDAPRPQLIFLRIRNMLTPDRYRRIKRDFLRVHRQYVLASDRKTNFDFGLITAGPLPAVGFAPPAMAASPKSTL